MSAESAARLVASARATNNRRDEAERKSGWATPGQGALDLRLRTAMSAIACGLQTDDFEAVAEGYCMLEDLHIAIHAEHQPYQLFT